MKKTLLTLFGFVLSVFSVFSQTIISQQDFEAAPASPAWNYTVSGTGGSIQSGQNSSSGRPASANLFNSGLQSFGVNNGTLIFDLSPVNTLYLKNIEFNLKLASYSTTTSTNGIESSDVFEVLCSVDGINFYKEIEVKGHATSNNACWKFDATGVASRFYSGAGNFGSFTASGGGLIANGHSSIVLTDLPSVPNLYFRISLKNNSTGELWLIDDVKLIGEENTSPTLLTTKKTISDINYLVNNGPSVPNNYALTGINLTPATGNIGLKAPANFEISLNESSGFGDTLTLAYADNSLTQTQIFTRLKSNLNVGVYGGTGFNIVHDGGGATNLNIKLDGRVSDGLFCGTPIDIDSVRRTIPIQSSYTGLVPYTIKGKVTGVFGSNKFYLQDSTGGIAIFQSSIVSTNSLKLGDWVSLTGIPTRFNGEAEIVSTTCFDKIAGGVVDSPMEFDTNNPPTDTSLTAFLNINEGKLVKIKSINVLNYGTFISGTNYNLSACNAQGFSEIRIDAGAVSIIGAGIPNITQDIIGVIGRFVNATGSANKTQIFPRYLSDFQESSVPCLPSGGCGVTSYTEAQDKLDVFNWNLEWLGNTGFGPTDEALQLNNCITVLNNAHADVYMLQEICSYNAANPEDNTTSFGKLIEGLNTAHGANTYTGECSSAYSYSYIDSPDPFGQRVCVIYKKEIVSKIFSRPMLDSMALASYPPTGRKSQFWGSGRLPFQFMAGIDIGGKKDTILFVGLHAKSGSAAEDYERRKFDVKVLYDTLQAQYPSRKTMVLGDLNDDLDQSIYVGGHASTYAPFLHQNPSDTLLNSVRPNPFWFPVTDVFSSIGCASTGTFSDYIDHQILSDEFMNKHSGFKYKTNSVTSYRPIIANYGSTTSDHYATISQFEYYLRPVLSPCSNLITLESPTDDYLNQTGDVFASKVNGKIVVTNIITNSSNIQYFAPSIELKPGFIAERGVVFKAQNGGCD
ncbi:MAG: hypothetical protein IPQ23_02155 [Cytophagaceae bacterium]|nr:hypothetical protein [Cytophagaceae bacterium]